MRLFWHRSATAAELPTPDTPAAEPPIANKILPPYDPRIAVPIAYHLIVAKRRGSAPKHPLNPPPSHLRVDSTVSKASLTVAKTIAKTFIDIIPERSRPPKGHTQPNPPPNKARPPPVKAKDQPIGAKAKQAAPPIGAKIVKATIQPVPPRPPVVVQHRPKDPKATTPPRQPQPAKFVQHVEFSFALETTC